MYLAEFPITSPFGPRGGGMHNGVDFGTPMNTPLPALVAGTVQYAGFIPPAIAGYSNELIIIVQSEGFFVVYGHLRGATVHAGQRVEQGQIIGTTGNSGYVLPAPTPAMPFAGAHLHIEQRLGTKENHRGLSAYPAKDITPLLRAYGSMSSKGGAEDMTYEDYAADILDVIEDNPWYAEQKPDAFKGHVNWLRANPAWEKRREWVKGIMHNNGVLNSSYMAEHLKKDRQYQENAEREMGQLSQDIITYKVDKESAEQARDQAKERVTTLELEVAGLRTDITEAVDAFTQERADWDSEKANQARVVEKLAEEHQIQLSSLITENEDLTKQLNKALDRAKAANRMSWREHLTEAFRLFFTKGGDN